MRGYDANELARSITVRNPGIRESQEYKNQMDEIIDETMSCDLHEAIEWMTYYMEKAVENGYMAVKKTGKPDNAQRCRFLAAYDLQNELKSIRV